MYEGECDGDQLQRLALDVQIFHRRLQDAKDAVLTQRIDLEEKQDAVQQAATAVADATREVEVLRKHREKSERRFLAELERKETNEQDEIASAMYETRRRQL
jgi:flagellar biosynthesis chaperone FliJ